MPKFSCKCKFDFSDVRPALLRFDRQVRKKVEEVGEEAVDYAIEHGTYHDVTGKTRSSNRYKVDGNNNLIVYNECDYAAELEAKGKDVVGNAAIFAEKRLKDIFE